MPKLEDFLPNLTEFVPTEEEYLSLYKLLLRTTILGEMLDDEAKKDIFIPKIFTGIGQEAIGVGAVLAAEEYDWFAPDHRVQGVLLGRGISEKEIICQNGAFAESIYGGYNFGIHIGDIKKHIIRFDSDMGINTAVGVGVINAMYYLRDVINKQKIPTGKPTGEIKNPVLLAFFGDGAMSHGNIHSAFKFATVFKLPVLFILNNNGRSIRTDKRYQNPQPLFASTAAGYGMPFYVLNPATDPVLMWRATKHAIQYLRQTPGRGPFFIECVTERVSGHNAHETMMMSNYVPKGLRKEWLAREPLLHYTAQLKKQGVLNEKKEKEIKDEASKNLVEAFDAIKTYTAPTKLHQVFAPSKPPPVLSFYGKNKIRTLTYGGAITEAMHQGLEIFPKLRIFGEDVESGGVHGITKKLVEKFGRLRVFHTPLDENGICTFAIGQAMSGLIPCMENQFFPFAKYEFGPLLNFAGTHYAVTGENLPLIIRAPAGGGFVSNHCHQEMIEALIAHAGGIKLVAPATPATAKGLLLSAFADGNPVIFIEQISHYNKKGEVEEDPYFLPIGEARVAREGKHLSIITYGAMMVERSLRAAEILAKDGALVEVLDLQTIVPMDTDEIIRSATKTEKVLVVHEAKEKFGVGAEIIKMLNAFVRKVRQGGAESQNNYLKDYYIKMDVLGAKDGSVTAHPALEKLRVPQVEDIVAEAKEMIL
ncbi:MAG: thiamine pyrophosphate-dependent enzyme [bacterium]|nr:thiamine pyrophosphate-dependent enzyme [bacterium]